jgi:amino acid transporter/mannitol/fructose-specific phosphotransferase system IIA component (Ntr-type)
MSGVAHTPRLRKELSLIDVYAIATGATLSSGLFLLPGLAAAQVGPSLVLCYAVAALPMVPATLAMVELATAMPRAGGAYYFLDRSLGPAFGTLGGLGTWLALTLKTAIALVGMGFYLNALFPTVDGVSVAAGLAVAVGGVNLLGGRPTGRFQVVLLAALLAILGVFLAVGLPTVDPDHFHGALDVDTASFLGTAGMLYVSYVGVTKVASVSEEVRNPERNLPLGVFLAFGTVLAVYLLGTIVITGVVPPAVLAGHPTAPAEAARRLFGEPGAIAISLAALLAFASVANAGVLSASRYPWAMGRDHLLPGAFATLRRGTPVLGVIVSVAAIVGVVLWIDVTGIAKLASAFQLFAFALVCLAVIVMRESGLASYDPGFRAPFYPWIPLLGVVSAGVLILHMGAGPLLAVAAGIAVALLWYRGYAAPRVDRHGAIYHVFERLGRRRFEGLDAELRGILKEKGPRHSDSFDAVLARATTLDLEAAAFEDVVLSASRVLEADLEVPADRLAHGFLEGTRTGATPVAGGVALPHLRLEDVDAPRLVAVRCRDAVLVHTGDAEGHAQPPAPTYAVFFLISPMNDPGQHLRLLAELATRIDAPDFLARWLEAEGDRELRRSLLHEERSLVLHVGSSDLSESWAERSLREIDLPEGCLIAVIHRGEDILIPRGSTRLESGDQLTIIGEPAVIRALRVTAKEPG